tara:strand:+ start:638 stop:883 length:246 start_codon:yes stop_codon:yes gene_type:complete
MQIGKDSSLSLNELKGALVMNEHNDTFRIYDFYVNLDDATKVMVSLEKSDVYGDFEMHSSGVELASLKNWTIQLQRGLPND